MSLARDALNHYSLAFDAVDCLPKSPFTDWGLGWIGFVTRNKHSHLNAMPDRISEKFGLKSEQFGNEGVFDGFWDVDSQFHVDPALLRTTKTPELKTAVESFREYFVGILKLIVQSKNDTDPLARAAIRKLTFLEIQEAALGFSSGSTSGRGWSPALAKNIFRTAKTIVDAGVNDPAIFELAGILEDKVGADLVSDMTLWVILPELAAFNARVIERLGLEALFVTIGTTSCWLPYLKTEQRSLLLLPADILSPLPVAESWDDIDKVCSYNQQVRARMNEVIGSTWKQAINNLTKTDLRGALIKEPEALRDLIHQYLGKEPKPYDFEADPLGEIIWRDVALDISKEEPIKLAQPTSHKQVVAVVENLVGQFKRNVEHNNLNILIFTDDGKHRPERFSQLLFFGIADCYCKANNIDLSREPNAGRGPVDFKMSKGYDSRVLVEIKLSANKKLINGYTKQVEAYQHAESSRSEYLVVIIVGDHDDKITALREIERAYGRNKLRLPKLIVVDARQKDSASKL